MNVNVCEQLKITYDLQLNTGVCKRMHKFYIIISIKEIHQYICLVVYIELEDFITKQR